MSICNELGLSRVAGGQILPGENWPEFTSSVFGKRKFLGGLVGLIVASSMEDNNEVNFRHAVAIFGEKAKPPIYSSDFMRFAYEAAGIEDTLSTGSSVVKEAL